MSVKNKRVSCACLPTSNLWSFCENKPASPTEFPSLLASRVLGRQQLAQFFLWRCVCRISEEHGERDTDTQTRNRESESECERASERNSEMQTETSNRSITSCIHKCSG
jgi:hypothetical protein